MTYRSELTPEMALLDYVAMGPNRSLRALHARYADVRDSVPDLVTFKRWSVKHDWQARVREHEAQVSGLMQAAAIENTAAAHLDMAADLHVACRRIIAAIVNALPTTKIASPEDLGAMASVAIRLSGHALEVERGRPPSAESLSAALRSISDNDATITKLPSAPEPPKTRTILEQFEELTGSADTKPN